MPSQKRLLGCAAGLALAAGFLFAVPAETVPKALIDYIQQARKLGLTEPQIRHNAVQAGWEAGAIQRAMGGPAAAVQDPGKEEAVAMQHSAPAGYRIGAGDVIQIIVWKEADASVPDVMVRADGRISLPLIKEVEVAGLTLAEAEKSLTDRLAKLINNPDVTVIPKQINSRKVYMVGGVRKEGPITLLAPMTVLQAITEAGGLSEYAKQKKIYVLRDEGGKQKKLPFNYDAVIKGQLMEQNIALMPNDTVVVPK
jgi:polysaccharide export outer membrane protein